MWLPYSAVSQPRAGAKRALDRRVGLGDVLFPQVRVERDHSKEPGQASRSLAQSPPAILAS